ncbi:unnamed protein product [Meloidogyne enterolobii]|uniref:Uncharacterized protein n=1 Tax=Meloidogyne enterolobii TaxID=390850 RepID=A0ACB0YM43_MELEN
MVYFRLGKCTICHTRLSPGNIYTLKNCNHTYHKNCITRWIEGGSETCPRCRTHATLDDIKQLFIEEAGDDSQESDDDEFTESTSNVVIRTPTLLNAKIQVLVRDLNNSKFTLEMQPNNTILDMKNKVYERKGQTVEEQRLIYSGQLLKDNYKLSHYKIGNNCIVDLVMRQNGGEMY